MADPALDGSDDTPSYLIPKMDEFTVSNSVFFKQLILTDPATESEANAIDAPINPFEIEPDDVQAKPATGVLLTFEQGWRQKGLALGELRKSLCLAPGEVTKLAVLDWDRTTTSRDTSARTQDEAVKSASDDSTAAEHVQQAVANEARTGTSFNVGSSQHTEGSFKVSGLLAGGGGSHASNSHMGFAASSSSGSREVASAAAKNIQRRTEQVAQSTRSTRATQIREVSESETQTTSTRVVANYNHAHALTMQYYEVLQIYGLSTSVVRADRCIFVPMTPLEFNEDALLNASDATIEMLRRVLREFGANQLDEMVGDFHENAPDIQELIDADTEELNRLLGEASAGNSDVERMKEEIDLALQRIENIRPRIGQTQVVEIPGGGSVVRHIPDTMHDRAEMAAATAAHAVLQANLSAAQEVHRHRARAAQMSIDNVRRRIAERRAALDETKRMFGILDENRLLLNQQMWMRIDEYTWHRKLAGKTYPDAPYQGQPIGGLIDPKPVGFFGNYVAFAWDFPRTAAPGAAGPKNAAEFEAQFVNNGRTSVTVALPTDGVFAEAVLGQSNSAEKIDLTRFWNWQDSPIPILPPSMAPVETVSRARNVAPAPALDFSDALVKLRHEGVTADLISDDALLAALKNSVVGSDAALLGAAATAGVTASNNAADGAGRSGQQTLDAMKNVQDFVVGMANSEAGKLATQAAMAGATGGVSSVGGLLNAASKGSKVINLVDKATGGSKKEPATKP